MGEWAPDYVGILKDRQGRLQKIRSSDKILSAAIVHYRENPIDFIEDWFFTFDPRQPFSKIPFILWPRQKEYILWLKDRHENKENGLVEKSRDAGATWLNMAYAIWLWRFRAGSKIGFGSRKEQLVDRLGDPDSIFEKGRFILNNIPREFLPHGFDIDKDAPYLKIINRENDSTITGEAGDNIGRGGRSTIYFKDESAFYERPMKIEAALSQNSDVKIDVSTPNGMGNPFYQKRHSGKIPVFVFDWKDDPRKTEEWYQKQKDTLDAVILAQEVDRDYGASAEGICIPAAYVKAAINFQISDSGKPIAALDVADEGGDENVFMWRKGNKIFPCEHWREGNTTQTTRKAHFLCREKGIEDFRYDSIGVGAGVKGEASELDFAHISVSGINTGVGPTPGEYAPGKKNEDMFYNLRAELHWKMRRRFERTYEHVNGIKQHNPEDMISIPDDHDLISELSQVKYKFSDSGKIQIESKEHMRARGLKSPNRSDTLLLLYAPGGANWTGGMIIAESQASKGDW